MGGYKRFGILLCLGVGLFLGSLIGIPEAGAAGEALKIDTGDTAWVLTSTALVLAMTMPGSGPPPRTVSTRPTRIPAATTTFSA